MSSSEPNWIMPPSGFVIPEKKLRRPAGPVDFSVLSEEQSYVLQELMLYVDDKTDFKSILVEGYAGVGKTFLISKFIEWLAYAKRLKVCVSAPTNKAVDVNKNMIGIKDPNISFLTLHKLLGLKEQRSELGRLYFTPDNNQDPAITTKDIVFVDEASMLDDKLFEYLYHYVDKDNLKVIFVGDPIQIPPINRLDSIPFLNRNRIKHKIQRYTLTHIHRQAADNPIIQFASAIRENIDSFSLPFDYRTQLKGESGIIVLNPGETDIRRLISKNYFDNQNFKDYSDFMKVVAYRNTVVNAANSIIRSLIFKTYHLPYLAVGEKLIADEPVKDVSGYTIFSTNAEFEVTSFKIKPIKVKSIINDNVVGRLDLSYYKTKVIGTSASDEKTYQKEKEIWILHESSLEDFKTLMALTKKVILNQPGKYERVAGWRTYYQLMETFAWVKYNYAITAHKAQGSTYQHAMVLDWDISDNVRMDKIVERNRIRYTAITRPKQYLFLISNQKKE